MFGVEVTDELRAVILIEISSGKSNLSDKIFVELVVADLLVPKPLLGGIRIHQGEIRDGKKLLQSLPRAGWKGLEA